MQKITSDIFWVGASDRRIALFENLFPLTNGVSYNSYLILDEKTALLDTVDVGVTRPYIENVAGVLDGRDLDYLILHHMEPDHCANIEAITELYPNAKLVGNNKTFEFLEQFYGDHLKDRYVEVTEGSELDLGKHKLTFVCTPMVHWPEVLMSYESTEKIFFTADAFGTFGALSGNLFDDEMDFKGIYLDEARRYYSNIVGKFGRPVQSALKKAKDLSIDMIAPLHGPILRENIDLMLEKYELWSNYQPEVKGVVLAYGSMYGNTAYAVDLLANMLSERGVKDIRVYDVSKTDVSYMISDIFKYSNIVLASATYNAGLYPKMKALVDDMAALNLQNRNYSIIGNGTWMTAASKIMTETMESMRNMTQIGDTLELKSRIIPEQMKDLEKLADDIVASLK